MRRSIAILAFAAGLWGAAPVAECAPPPDGPAASTLAAPTPQPSITYFVDGLTVLGNTPGGKVILFGLSRRPMGTAAFTARRWLIQTADASGMATFTFGSKVPRSSIYAAVDFESGAYAVATPDTYPLRRTAFPIAALRKSGDLYTQLGLDRVGLEILCVRPKKNAWRVFLTDCSKKDRDGTCNGKLSVDADAMQPLISMKDDLKDFKQHDIVIIIDPLEMDIMTSEVGK